MEWSDSIEPVPGRCCMKLIRLARAAGIVLVSGG
jgi:hypothetical protein